VPIPLCKSSHGPYVERRPDDSVLRKRLEELAAERRRFGFRRLTVLRRREVMKGNVKRIMSVYLEANLQVRRRVRRVADSFGLRPADTQANLEVEAGTPGTGVTEVQASDANQNTTKPN
jgi:hypothetical protein